MSTLNFTGVNLICPKCDRQVEPASKPTQTMRGTTLQYAHRGTCPALWARKANAKARLVIQGSRS